MTHTHTYIQIRIHRTFHNPSINMRDYSCYSSVHNVYSRIDYFLTDAKHMPYIHNCVYHNIIISDHCPVTFSLHLDDVGQSYAYWRLNPQWLSRPPFCKFSEMQIKVFFEINDIPETSPSLLWDTFKAYIRGCVISYQAYSKKQNRVEQVRLENQIHQLDMQNATHPSAEKHNKIAALKYKLNQILSARICKAFQYTKQKHFEFGDKPHTRLARQLRKFENNSTIHRIKAQTGVHLTLTTDINLKTPGVLWITSQI